ncbi:MAG: hypothetical protein QME76_03565 [Bacillota bacterium]|nr:hypothetical protein [Bacillota bacterium]
MRKKVVALIVLLAALAGAGAGLAYRHVDVARLLNRGDMVTADTRVIEERVYLCGDSATVRDGPAVDEMVGLDLAGLLERYPSAKGWSVTLNLPESLLITRHAQEFCPAHAPLRHLGLYGDYVAVYEGPLGHNERLWRVSETPAGLLPPDLQERLKQAMAFDRQVPAVKAELRQEFEFTNEDAAAAVLENLDELQD